MKPSTCTSSKLLSVVVPVYNVEKYIDKCLSSLILPEEELAKLDVVIINDGTPDRSAEIARRYEIRYPDVFRVFDQENRGHGGAWNHGTELAVGKYLFYLDSDDWFDTGELSRLLKYLETCNTDMVMLNCMMYYATSGITKINSCHPSTFEPERVYETNQFDWCQCKDRFWLTFPQDAVYKTEMLKRGLPLFCEKVRYDDLSCHVIPIILAKDFIYTNINVYRYLMGRPGQSYDQNVLKIYCIGDKMAVNQFVLSWIHRHEDMIEKEGTCRKWVNVYYQEIIKYEYGVMFFASYGQSKYYLAQWDAFVLAECPDFNPSISIKMYRSLPFPVFYCFARIAGLARDGYKVLFGK